MSGPSGHTDRSPPFRRPTEDALPGGPAPEVGSEPASGGPRDGPGTDVASGRPPAGDGQPVRDGPADPPGSDAASGPVPADAASDDGPVDEPPPEAASGPMPAGVRRARVERAVRGTLAGSLILEALMVLFVPRAIAPLRDEGLTGGRLAFLLGLAAALVVASALQRRRAGLVLGTVLQVPVIAAGRLVAVMYVLGLLFAGVWIYLLRVRRELLGAAPPAGTR
ncbi:MAG: DUF4233 domain-containing protein [Mycobacteriales bacterium]